MTFVDLRPRMLSSVTESWKIQISRAFGFATVLPEYNPGNHACRHVDIPCRPFNMLVMVANTCKLVASVSMSQLDSTSIGGAGQMPSSKQGFTNAHTQRVK